MNDFFEAIKAVMGLGAQLQNGGGLLFVLFLVWQKLANLDKLVQKHNDILFPAVELEHHHIRTGDKKKC